MVRRGLAAVALWTCALGQGEATFGAEAPESCWPLAGGAFSRSCVAAGAPALEGLAVAWEWTPPKDAGEIEGEPVVWSDVAYVTTAAGGKKRTLFVVDLLDGATLGSQTFQTTAPLLPSVWGGFVVVRAAPNRLAAYRISGGKPVEFEFFKPDLKAAALSGPVFTGRHVYVRADDRVAMFEFKHEDRPVYATTVPGAHGELALRGDHVFVAAWNRGELRIVYVRRADGALAGETTGTQQFLSDGSVWVAALPDRLFAFGGRIPKGPAAATAALFERKNEAAGALSFVASASYFATPGTGAVPWGDGFVAGAVDSERGPLLFRARSGEAFAEGAPPEAPGAAARAAERARRADLRVLADKDLHPEFRPDDAGPTRIGGAVLVPGGAYDGRSSRILARFDAKSRVVPVRGGVVAVRRSGALALWRRAEVAASRPAARDLPSGVVVWADGGVTAAPLRVDDAGVSVASPGAGTAAAAAKPKPVDWRRVIAVFERGVDGDRIVHAATPSAHADGIAAAADATAAAALADVALRACDAGDADLARAALDDALTLGADLGKDAPATAAQRRLRNGLKVKPDPAAAKALAEAADRARATAAARLAATAATHAASDVPRAAMFLRRALMRDPKHPEALRTLAELVPAGFALPDAARPGFDSVAWARFVDLAARERIGVVARPKGEAKSKAEAALGRAVAMWGDLSPEVAAGLYAFGDEDVTVVARSVNPLLAAECAAASRLVCRALRRLFPQKTAPKEPPGPLEVWLFPNKAEFLRQSAKEWAQRDRDWAKKLAKATGEELKRIEEALARGAREGLVGVAGFYDDRVERAKLFTPEAEDPLQSTEEVFRHELTHAWLDLRNPRAKAPGARRRGRYGSTFRENLGGYWCVEGFPTFLMEQRIDPESGEIHEAAATLTLDAVAHLSVLLPWKDVVAVPQLSVNTADNTGADWRGFVDHAAEVAGITAPPFARLRTFVGIDAGFDPALLFYRQSAALCHYLYFAEGGKRRETLLDFITGYYDGDERVEDFEAHFGMSAAEAGSAAVAYARSKFK